MWMGQEPHLRDLSEKLKLWWEKKASASWQTRSRNL